MVGRIDVLFNTVLAHIIPVCLLISMQYSNIVDFMKTNYKYTCILSKVTFEIENQSIFIISM